MFRVYSKEQEGNFYLSPYTDVFIDNEKLVIIQTLYNCIVMLKAAPDYSNRLLNALQQGVHESVLFKLLNEVLDNEEVEKTVNNWMCKGVLE